MLEFDEMPIDIILKMFNLLDKEDLSSCFQINREIHNFLIDSIENGKLQGSRAVFPPVAWKNASKHGKLGDFQFSYKKMILSGVGYSPIRPNVDVFFRNSPKNVVRESVKTSKMRIEPEGDGMILETNGGNGCERHADVFRCIAFSSEVQQIDRYVDLVAAGIDEWVLDFVRPTIRVTQKVSHFYCPGWQSFASVGVRIEAVPEGFSRFLSWHADSRFRIVCKEFRDSRRRAPDRDWHDIVIDMDDYPSGMRHVFIMNLGGGGPDDGRIAFGGPKFANLEIRVLMPEEPRLKAWK